MDVADRRSQIAEMILNCPDFKELSKLRDVYCPFEALAVSRLEIRHSNFLADLLDPLRPHGFGDAVLRVFLQWLLDEADEQKLLLDIHFDDVARAQVFREWKHIDLLIHLPSEANRSEVVVAVEIKVESQESAGQLERYEAAVQSAWPNAKAIYFFLAPDGCEASRDNWNKVSFDGLISRFEEVIKTTSGEPEARMMLQSYVSMMRRKYVPDDDLNAMVQKVWSKHRDILDFLMERKPNPASAFVEQLSAPDTVKHFNDALSEHGIEIEVDRCSGRYVTYVIKSWSRFTDILTGDERWSPKGHILKVELDVSEARIGIHLVLGRGDQSAREAIFRALVDGEAPMSLKRKNPTKEWTRMASKTLRNTKHMEAILAESGDEDKEFNELKGEVTTYLTELLPAFDDVLKNSTLKRV